MPDLKARTAVAVCGRLCFLGDKMIAALTRPHGMSESRFAAAARAIDACHQQTPTQAVREFRGLTQLDLAKRSGVSLGTIIALENGQAPDTLLLAAIATSLEVPKSLLKGRAPALDN